MLVDVECTYCGQKWEENVYNQSSLHDMKCKYCKDKNLKFKDKDKSKIDYYQGCPPFPEKPKDDDRYMWTRRSN